MFFKQVWNRADALLFLRGRLHFHHVNGDRAAANAGAPSVLIAYGTRNVEALERVQEWGQLVKMGNRPKATDTTESTQWSEGRISALPYNKEGYTMQLIAKCWTCGKEYDIGRWSAQKNGVRCDADGCDGFVISPSGKVQFRIDGEIEPGEPTLKLIEEVNPQ